MGLLLPYACCRRFGCIGYSIGGCGASVSLCLSVTCLLLFHPYSLCGALFSHHNPVAFPSFRFFFPWRPGGVPNPDPEA